MNNMKASFLKSMHSITLVCAALPGVLIAASSMANGPEGDSREASFIEWADETVVTALRQRTRYDISVIEAGFYERFRSDIEDLRSGDIENAPLSELFDSALAGLFYTQSEPIGVLMYELVFELDRRSLTTDVMREMPHFSHPAALAHSYLVNARLFDLSADLEAHFAEHVDSFPISIQTPAGHDPRQPAILVETEGNPLDFTVQPVPIETGDWFVAVVSSDCYFSREATLWIEDNVDRIKSILPQNHLWVSNQSRTRDWLRQSAWNSQAKLTRANLVYRDEAWRSVIEVGLTPAFYVLRDGLVVDHFSGWPGEERSEDLIALLERLGRPGSQAGASPPHAVE
ncbi:MAG: hypothetical protein ACXIUM_02030 [Wenzhouxiangella sp.]